MTLLAADIQAHWSPIAPILSLRDEQEYDAAVERLNALVDEVGTNENHPLYGLLDTLGTLVHAYEEQHVSIPAVSGPEALTYLLEEHALSPDDLREIGLRESVENYLSGKAELSLSQVRALAKRFHVSPALFID